MVNKIRSTIGGLALMVGTAFGGTNDVANVSTNNVQLAGRWYDTNTQYSASQDLPLPVAISPELLPKILKINLDVTLREKPAVELTVDPNTLEEGAIYNFQYSFSLTTPSWVTDSFEITKQNAVRRMYRPVGDSCFFRLKQKDL